MLSPGCHWLFELMRMLTLGSSSLEVGEKQTWQFELNTKEHLDLLPSPRILTSHLSLAQLPRDVVKRGTRLVLITRHPKDVAVSYYNLHTQGPWWQYGGHFRNWIKLFYEGTCTYLLYYSVLWGRVYVGVVSSVLCGHVYVRVVLFCSLGAHVRVVLFCSMGARVRTCCTLLFYKGTCTYVLFCSMRARVRTCCSVLWGHVCVLYSSVL